MNGVQGASCFFVLLGVPTSQRPAPTLWLIVVYCLTPPRKEFAQAAAASVAASAFPPMMMLLIGMKISLTKKPMKPMIVNPIIVCKQIFLYSAQSRGAENRVRENGARDRNVRERGRQAVWCGVRVCVWGGRTPAIWPAPHHRPGDYRPFSCERVGSSAGVGVSGRTRRGLPLSLSSHSARPPTLHLGGAPPTFTRGFLTYLWRQAWCTSSPASTSSWRSP